MINMVFIYLLFFGITMDHASLAQQENNQNQGIEGLVLWRSGNLMPSPDLPTDSAKGKPIVREILVYKLTSTSEVKQDGIFYSSPRTIKVARTRSDSMGKFCVKLPPGKYTLFVVEEKGLFANRLDGHNNINPVEVKSGKMTHVELIVDYKAAY
jgi:hypothetical protein